MIRRDARARIPCGRSRVFPSHQAERLAVGQAHPSRPSAASCEAVAGDEFSSELDVCVAATSEHSQALRCVPMAEITRGRQGELVQTLFRILDTEPEGLQAKDAIARVAEELELTEFEKATFPKNPGVVRFPKLLRFSTIGPVKAGW